MFIKGNNSFKPCLNLLKKKKNSKGDITYRAHVGSRPVILPSRFANFNCFNSKTSVYFYYKISVFFKPPL